MLCLLISAALVILAVATSTSTAKLRAEYYELDERLHAGEARALLREQQLDELFQDQSERWSRTEPLAADDLTQLRIWMSFDTAFVLQNRDDPSLLYERALAHHRLGHCALLIEDYARSIEHSREAGRLYEILAADFPSPDYIVSAATMSVLAGDALFAAGDSIEAIRAYESGIELLGGPQLQRTSSGEALLSEWKERLRDIQSSVSGAEDECCDE